MVRPLAGTLTAFATVGGALLATLGAAPESAAAPAPAPAVKAATFAGTVALNDCSGSVVRMPNSADTDKAFVLSNGHCLETGFPDAGKVIVNQASTRTFTLLNASGDSLGQLRATKVAYATMTDTDISLYELSSTYAQIKSAYGIRALKVSAAHPTAGTAIDVVSGYWKRIYSCNIDAFVPQLREGQWTWKDSVRYTRACQTIGGTSGSPVLDRAGRVIAVNNTINEAGERCTDNNPCEVDADGNVTVHEGIDYGQQTYWIPGCVATGNKIDLRKAGCALPKP